MSLAGRRLAVLVLAAAAAGSLTGRPIRNRSVYLLIDLDILACSPCSDWLEEIGRALPPEVQAAALRAVVTYRDPDGEGAGGRRSRIARLQWQGFARHRRLVLPVAFDDGQAFRETVAGGAAALLFDFETGMVKKLSVPLGRTGVAEIMAFLSR
jgi:hypothetical protein